MSKIYIYERCSHASSADTGIGLDIQRGECTRYVKYTLSHEFPDATLRSMFRDTAVSASMSLCDRPAGKKLNEVLEMGDHIVIAKVDRGFKNMVDLVNQIERWKRRKIHIHFVDLNCDITSTSGEMMLYLKGIFANADRRSMCERSQACHEKLRKDKRPQGPRSFPGMRIVGKQGRRRFVPMSVKEIILLRTVPAEIVRLHDAGRGMWWTAIAEHIAKLFPGDAGNIFPAQIWDCIRDRKWAKKWYLIELRWQHEESLLEQGDSQSPLIPVALLPHQLG